jgi:hypothetical protein
VDITESKVPCAVRFFEDGERLLAGPLDAVLHLFWHRYNDRLAFWHGAAEVRWDAASYLKECASVPVNGLVA